MKILVVTNLGYEHGGVETQLMLLKPLLEAAGHEVKILTSNAKPELTHFSDFEFEALDHQPGLLKLAYRAFYPHAFFALRKALRQYRPDIVHIHTISQMSPSVLFCLRNYPAVITVNQTEDFTLSMLMWGFPPTFFKDGSYRQEMLTLLGKFHYLYHRFVSRSMYLMGFRNVNAFVTVSEFMKRALKSDGIEAICIPNGTQLFEYAPLDLAGRKLLYIGRLEKFKGVQYLIEAFPDVLKACPDVTLSIVGRGSYQEDLVKLARSLDLQQSVEFLGHTPRADLYNLYKAARIVVIPSIWPEPFGLVGIEAMSVGRPVIAFDVGGVSDWLNDGETGYLIRPKQVAELSEKIIYLCTHDDVAEKMSFEARKRSTRFTIQNHAAKIIALYNQILADGTLK